MRRRGLIGGVLLLALLLAGCGEKSKPEAASTTVTEAAPATTTERTLTVIVSNDPPSPPPPPARPVAPKNLPDEFLLIDRHGRLVALDGTSLGTVKGADYPYITTFSDDANRAWTFKNGKLVQEKRRLPKLRLPGIARQCMELGNISAGTLVSCYRDDASLFLRDSGGAVRALVPPPPDSVGGHWAFAFPSPDGSRLLLYWSGECEAPNAFFAPSSGGTPTEATGASDWRKAPESSALGWTSDGRALVLLRESGCGYGTRPPGVYAVDGYGGNTFLVKAHSAAFFHR